MIDRRRFLQVSAMSLYSAAHGQTPNQDDSVPRRPLGRTGVQVSALGIGGYHLGSAKDQTEATQIVREAVDNGVIRHK